MHALLSTFGSTGDVQPMFALAAELRNAGHHPVMALSPNFEARASALGFEFAATGPAMPTDVIGAVMNRLMQASSPAEQVRHFLDNVLVALPDMYRDLAAACEGADVLIGSPFQFACRMVHDTTGIPYVSIHLSQFGDLGTRETREVCAAAVNPYRMRLGLASLADPLGEDGTSKQLALYAVSPQILTRPGQWPESRKITGFFFLDETDWQPDPALVNFCADDEKPVVITFGSMVHADPAAMTSLVLGAAERIGRRIVVQHGWSGLAGGALPPHVYATGFAPHSWLFTRAALVVHHGGAGTSASAFRAGVPTVVVPHMLDQPIWAEIARSRGCARNVIPLQLLTPARLAAAVNGSLKAGDLHENAARLAAKIKAEPGVSAARKHIEDLIANGRTVPGNAPAKNLPVIPKAHRGGDLPVSFGQQRLWFLDQLNPGSPTYNMAFGLRLRGPLDRPALERSVQDLVQRHEILRTSFPSVRGIPVQRIEPHLDIPVPERDLTAETPARRLQVLQEHAAKWARQPFDLAAGPLLRAELLNLDESEHILLLNMHHIVSDGWSMTIAVRDIHRFYLAHTVEQPVPAPLDLQFADITVWQNETFYSAACNASIDYWRKRLEGLREPDLSFGRQPGGSGANVSANLDSRLVQRLRELNQKEGVTMFMTLLGVFQILLSKYTGEHDIAAGSVIGNRTRSEVQDLIGFFANTLVLRTNVGGNPSFSEALRRVRETALEAYIHQDAPFVKVVEAVRPGRARTGSPLFRALFLHEGGAAPSGIESDWDSFEIETGTAKFDLTLRATESAEHLKIALEYDTGLFDEPAARRMIGHYRSLIANATADPSQPLSLLSMLSPDERKSLIALGRPQQSVGTPPWFVHEAVCAQAARTPDAVAVQDEVQTVTYGQLHARALGIASRLRNLGARPDVPVGICMERSAGLVPAVLGVLEAGACYLPLDPTYPAERLRYMLADSGCAIVLTDRPSSDLFASYAGLLVSPNDCAPGNADDLRIPLSADNLAYLIYTSGSTGRPKGVAVRHSSAAVFLEWALRTFSHAELNRVLASTSLSFDLSVFEIFAPLSCGGCAVIARDVLDLVHRSADVTLINSVPSAVRELVRANAIPDTTIAVNLAGEVLTPDLVNALFASSSARRVLNLYGPTEDTVYSTFAAFEREPAQISSTPIGRPISHSAAYVLDDEMEPTPVGIPGELYLGGAGLARGYQNSAAVTAARFVPNPFGDGERLYRTGDLARFEPDGGLVFLGRKDHQVKIHGFRIEPGEIEQALLAIDHVREAAVVAHSDSKGEAHLAAYIVPANGAMLDSARLRRALRQRLPAHMIPAAFTQMPALPRTPNGKPDRKALPAPSCAPAADAQAATPPRTPVESTLCQIWQEVLCVERVGVETNFFDAGGHSLLATQISSRIADAFRIVLPVRSVFETPTIAGLAGTVEALLLAPEGARVLKPIRRAKRAVVV